jgi:hypothetical protein
VQMRWAITAILITGASCDAGSRPLPQDDFYFCNIDPTASETIGISYRNLRGSVTDQGRALSRCKDPKAVCIEYPLALSTPPRMPRGLEVVRWSAADNKFLIRALAGSKSTYVIEVENFRRGRGGQLGLHAREFYTYREDEGFTSRRLEGAPAGELWVRCEGRLTFGDLRALNDRLRNSKSTATSQ